MAYVHSSPWQDAANFGGSVGDRLAEALINLPLKRQQLAQQLLQNQVILQQRANANKIQQQKVGIAEDTQFERAHHDRMTEPSPYKSQIDVMGKEIGTQAKENAATESEIKDLTKFNVGDDTKRMGIDQRAQAVHERMLSVDKAQALKVPHEELHGLSLEKAMEAVQNPTKYNMSEEQADELAKTIPVVYNRIKQGVVQEQGGSAQSNIGNNLGGTKATPPSQGGRFKYDPASGQLIPIQ